MPIFAVLFGGSNPRKEKCQTLASTPFTQTVIHMFMLSLVKNGEGYLDKTCLTEKSHFQTLYDAC